MKRLALVLMTAVTLGLAGCGTTPDEGANAGLGGIGPGGMDGGAGLGRPGGGDGSLYGGAGGAGGAGAGGFTESDRRVYFGYDSALISDEARQLLQRNIPKIKSGGGVVTVEGHADERGTREYNLALAQQRAEAVKQFLILQGVNAGKIKTISYGKERPLVDGHDEFAWTKNRRAELLFQ
ncbi:MAG: OmpA family protein [Magnetococcales bacterium]|nr:OmpA family protein [Magnetococcales bacterium]NGZ28775.1 OmpA family protein [Magnetococcales bacterium]